MNTKDLVVNEKITGATAYEIAEYLLKQNHLEMADECYTIAVEEWINEKNNNDTNNRFVEGKTIKVPAEENDIINCVSKPFNPCNEGVSTTRTHDGWRLTIHGQLLKGKSGWLRDENGLYILKDGRRLNEKHKECTNNLKIGAKDVWEGLNEILGNFREIPRREYIYETSDLLRDYGPHMSEVVYQAFQINQGYDMTELSTWKPCTRYNPEYKKSTLEQYETPSNCSFGTIGRDETNIPIIVTRVGNANASKKIVIAGPHGNERIARFVVLETQKHFINNGVSDPDLVLYFIPAMSPTLFFADARGVPFIKEMNNTVYELQQITYTPTEIGNNTWKEQVKKYLLMVRNLSIPKLHDLMATKHNGTLVHTLIQNQEDPIKPLYGIDANRDYHLVLPSSQRFAEFVKPLTGVDVQNKTGINNGSCIIFMLHGYESIKDTRRYNDQKLDKSHGVIYTPYLIEKNNKNEYKRYLDKDLMKYADFVNLFLFGYRFKREKVTKDQKDFEFTLSKNYIYQSENNADMYRGEWSWLFYGGTGKRGVLTFDIELGEDYRQKTRGLGYDPNKIIKRSDPINKMPFFQNGQEGKFVNNKNGGKITFVYPETEGKKQKPEEKIANLSFYDFLIDFYFLFEKARKSEEII